MGLTDVDRDLLKKCLTKQPGAWNDFVDRFLGLIYHTIHYSAHSRSARISPEEVEDIAAEVLLQLIADDYKALRRFDGKSSLVTYITVIARRTCVHELTRRHAVRESIRNGDVSRIEDHPDDTEAAIKGIEKLEEVESLIRRLSGNEREIVSLFYLEGRSYEEISTILNVPVNSIGSVLSRARAKLREQSSLSSQEIPAIKPKVVVKKQPKSKP